MDVKIDIPEWLKIPLHILLPALWIFGCLVLFLPDTILEKINILCTLLLILVGEYIFYYRYKKGTLKGISKIYFDINNSLSIIIVVSFSIIGIVFLL